MTRKLFSATLLAVLLACFNACDNDTDEAPLPGALPYTKSYFVGLMNDSLISIKQDSYYDFRIDPLLYVPQDPYYQTTDGLSSLRPIITTTLGQRCICNGDR